MVLAIQLCFLLQVQEVSPFGLHQSHQLEQILHIICQQYVFLGGLGRDVLNGGYRGGGVASGRGRRGHGMAWRGVAFVVDSVILVIFCGMLWGGMPQMRRGGIQIFKYRYLILLFISGTNNQNRS